MAVDIIVVYDTQPMYLISATLVTGDHVSVVFAGGLVHAATTETAVVRHRATFGKEFGFFFSTFILSEKSDVETRARSCDIRIRTGTKNKILNKQTMRFRRARATTCVRILSLGRRDRTAVFRERGDQHARRRIAD